MGRIIALYLSSLLLIRYTNTEKRAKFNHGIIEPLEKLEIEEGREVLITVNELDSGNRFLKAAGGWKRTLDCEKLIENIYNDRIFKISYQTVGGKANASFSFNPSGENRK